MKNQKTLFMFGKYVSLNVIAMIGLSCYILADTFFVANGVGVNGLTALNLAIPVYSFINGLGLMVGIGGGTKYAIYKAQNNDRAANEIFTHAAVMGAAVGILFLAAGIVGSSALSRLLGGDQVTFGMTNTYLKTLMCFAPAFILNNVLVAFVRNDGAPNLSMAAMLAGSISNIILDYIFIFPFKMGMFGAAFATGLAPVISMIVLSGYFRRHRNQFHLIRCKINTAYFKTVSALGIASLITEVSSGIVIIVFNTVILTLEGNLGVAAYGIIANLALVATAIFTGVAQGVQPLVSESYGSGKEENITRYIRYAVITSLAAAVVLFSVIWLFAAPVSAVFNNENNAVLGELAVSGLRIYFTGFFFAGLNIVLASWFSSVEKPIQSFTISILRGCVLIIPILLLLSAQMEIQGVWLTYPLAEMLTFILALAAVRKSSRAKKSGRKLDNSLQMDENGRESI